MNVSNLSSFDTSSWLKEISNKDVYKNREAGTKYGRASAGKIVQALKQIKMLPGVSKISYFQKFEASVLDGTIASQNIIARSHSHRKSSPEIIISAHYNRVNFCQKSSLKSQYCFVKTDNSLGVVTALKLAAMLRKHSPNTSFALTLWGAEELINSGSQYFDRFPSFDKKQTRLVVNLDLLKTTNSTMNYKEITNERISSLFISNHNGTKSNELDQFQSISQIKKITNISQYIFRFINDHKKEQRALRGLAGYKG